MTPTLGYSVLKPLVKKHGLVSLRSSNPKLDEDRDDFDKRRRA
jgi:hypothetical protein